MRSEFLRACRIPARRSLSALAVFALAGSAHAGGGGQSIVDWTGLLSDDWNTAGNWTPSVVPNNGGGMTYAAMLGASTVSIDGVISVDRIEIGAGGLLSLENAQRLTIIGDPDVMDGDDSVGLLRNLGTFRMDSVGNTTDFRLSTGTVTLGDGMGAPGTMIIGQNSNNRIFGAIGTETLRNLDAHTITGGGQFGLGSIGIENHGVIQASNTTMSLNANASGITNTNLLRATSNGVLNIQTPVLDNMTGVLLAEDTSRIELATAVINGGMLMTSASGEIRVTGAATFNDVTNDATLIINNGTTGNFVSGQLTNLGSVNLLSVGNSTYLRLNGDVTLTGGGEVFLSGNSANWIWAGTVTPATLTNTDNLIRGGGNLGSGDLDFVNQAEIRADQGVELLVTPQNSFVNEGLLRATAGATMRLNAATYDNESGEIRAEDGSTVNLFSASIYRGLINTQGTGVVASRSGSTLEDVTITGRFLIPNNTSTTRFIGSLVNKGQVDMNSVGNATYMRLDGDFTLSGGGTVNMSNNNSNWIYAWATPLVFTNEDNLIRGSGHVGDNDLRIINRGEIRSDQAVQLEINPVDTPGFLNEGILRAGTGSTLLLSPAVYEDAGGMLLVEDDARIDSNGATFLGGSIEATGTGFLRPIGPTTLDNITLDTPVNLPNGRPDLRLRGDIDNLRQIDMNSVGNETSLRIDGDVTLGGGGTVNLSNNTQNYIYAWSGSPVFTNLDNTIRGSGHIGQGNMTIEHWGEIVADQPSTLTLVSSSGGFINNGCLRADGGVLRFTNGLYDSTNGLIEVWDGSRADLINCIMHRGELATYGSGYFRTQASVEMEDVFLVGQWDIPNNYAINRIRGDFDFYGTINLQSAGNTTALRIEGDVTMFGLGEILMSNNIQNYIYAWNGQPTLTLEGPEIRGGGSIGQGNLNIVSRSMITANVSSALSIWPGNLSGFRNEATVRADDGYLRLRTGVFHNEMGIIDAINNSRIDLDGPHIIGGDLSADASSVINATTQTAILEDVTLSGRVVIPNNIQGIQVRGTLTHLGRIELNSVGNTTGIRHTDGAIIDGPGEIFMRPNINNGIWASSTGALLTNNTTIRGSGFIGANQSVVVNNGTIISEGTTLTIDAAGTGFQNHGELIATSNMVIGPDPFSTDGNVTINPGATLSRTSLPYTQTGGFTMVDGSLNTNNVVLNGGDLGGTGTIQTSVVNTAGNVTPGNSTGTLTVTGNFTQMTGGRVSVEIGDGAHDTLQVNGSANLDGELVISLIDGFVPMPTQSFTVLSAAAINGAFTSTSFTNLPASVTYSVVPTPTSISVVFGSGCTGDTNGDGLVNFTDLNALLDNWSTTGPEGDVNGSGFVDFADLNLLLDNWGLDCN